VFYENQGFKEQVLEKILKCVKEVALAVQHMHSQNLLHLNLHAGNVLDVQCGYKEISYGYYISDPGF